MKIEIVSTVTESSLEQFVVSLTLDRGEHARTINLPIHVQELLPKCSNYSETMNSAYRITVLTNEISSTWIFRNKIVSADIDPSLTEEEYKLEVMHAVLRRDKKYNRLRRSLNGFKLMNHAEEARRETIPEAVRIFVWQRDSGKCVRCGNNQKLEFDHIIPISKGGSNTERNIQLLCERCNREKGTHI